MQTQTTSQKEGASVNPRNPTPTFSREPHEGNVLWQLYKELGYTGTKAFWAMCASLPLAKQTFYKYSKAGYKLGDIDVRVFMALREFFLAHGGHDIMGDFLDEQEHPTHYTALPE